MSEKLMQDYVRPVAIVGVPLSLIPLAVGGINKFKTEHDQAALLDYETANTLFYGGLTVTLVSLFLLALVAKRKN